jgi:hypothetical protein
MKSETVSAAEAARMLGVRMNYVYCLLWSGTLDGTKVDGFWQIKRQVIEEYRERGRRLKTTLREPSTTATAA